MATYTVYKRENKNGFSWQYDIKDKSFKNGKKRKAGFKTKGEAVHAAQKIIEELNAGNYVEDKYFKDYYNTWLDINNKSKLSKKQFYWFERALTLFLEHFGDDMLVKNITRSEYQRFINNYADGRTTETVRKVHDCLKACIKDALYDGHLKKDPTYKINIKGTVAAKKEEAKFMTIEQYISLMEYFKSKSELSYIALYILAITGARFSEVNRMTTKDIDYINNIIHIPGTKTVNADRYVEVSKKDIITINKRLSQHPLRIDGKLFGISHNALKNAFERSKQACDIKDEFTPYALRHTHASYLISKQIPIEYISKRLGHANINITLTVYTHLLDEHKKEQGQRVREIFS
ncbi:tyrosine-type recombinase/integrase [Macrococcus capreoli]|uniref:tyrosine-type recombinase/integrase n=1 Tax=Macrococcus capreoli TaxID=2982690 RepID=UPI0021D5A125|nr:site-specific integrase [Macrococcus sp. TMW 2.2395]MCU7557294.1 site-specific integrase [Macrococcus sp. TMW 2.2395]